MLHKIEIKYENGRITFNTGYLECVPDDIIEFIYTGDRRGPVANLNFELANVPGTSFAPFTTTESSLTVLKNAETTKKRTVGKHDVTVKYSIDLDGHKIDPIIIIIPTRRRLRGRITNILSSRDILQLLGVNVRTDADTEFIDETTCMPTFGFEDLSIGDYVEVTAYDNGARASATATSVVSHPPTALSTVEGPVYNVQGDEFDVAGVTVRINQDSQLFSNSGKTLSPKAFLDRLSGSYALVCGNWMPAAGRLVAVTASLLD